MMTSRRLTSVFAVLTITASLLLGGLGCKKVDKVAIERSKPLTLKFWRVFDGSNAFDAIISDYSARYPHITIDYRVFRYDEYEKMVLDGLAEDKGPDIISLHNDWMYRWQPRLLPSPQQIAVPLKETVGTIKKEDIVTMQVSSGVTPKQVRNDFVETVADDVIIKTPQADPRAPLLEKVYGLPLSVDTLALFYNRDILNAVGISQPAATWDDFQKQVSAITQLDEVGTILRAGAALGTADNVERSSDILSLIMMQNGALMSDANRVATFDRFPTGTEDRPLPPGAEALVFYADFANPEKIVYTWNDKMPNSLQAFVKGQAAFFIGYSYHLPTIRNLNPSLNLGVAPFPQIRDNRPVNFANYWIETVSKKTKYPDEAWDFVRFITSPQEVQKYLAAAKKPTALRSLVNSQLEDLDLSVFASQVLTAKSWYRGQDAAASEQIFRDMITQSQAGEADFKRIVELGATRVNQTIK